MRVISRRALREFWERHPSAKSPMAIWFKIMETGAFAEFSALKKTFGTADYPAPYTIFDLAGNKYRVVALVRYDRHRIYFRHVFTHEEYDAWSQLMRATKRSRR
jgi:mRNA interferase HigB